MQTDLRNKYGSLLFYKTFRFTSIYLPSNEIRIMAKETTLFRKEVNENLKSYSLIPSKKLSVQSF